MNRPEPDFILFTYPKIAPNCGHKILLNNANNTIQESRYIKDWENVKLVNLPPCGAAPLPLILDMISKSLDLGVRENTHVFTEMYF